MFEKKKLIETIRMVYKLGSILMHFKILNNKKYSLLLQICECYYFYWIIKIHITFIQKNIN